MGRRVVVTGFGAVTPLGLNAEDTWRELLRGTSGIGPITHFDASGFDVRIAAEVKGFNGEAVLGAKNARRMDRYCQLAMCAGFEALSMSGLDVKRDPERVGVLLGSGIGGMTTWEKQHAILIERGPDRVSPMLIPMMILNMASGNLATEIGAKGPCMSVVTACATASHCIGEAYHIIRRGDADAVICGGSEAAVTPVSVAGFTSMKALSTRNDEPTRASRPFDAERDGFVIAEGAGALVLEDYDLARARGAECYAELVGYGLTADAFHMTQPAPEGEGARRSMQMALRSAGMAPEQVDYINAHGTSTPYNDARETEACHAAFGDHARKLAISSTKSMTGHLLGAAGAVELIFCIQAIRDGVVPPTINYETPDPECDLDYVPNEAREMRVNVAMSNSFGFGGQNATVAVKRM